jgi:hypothetical protein
MADVLTAVQFYPNPAKHDLVHLCLDLVVRIFSTSMLFGRGRIDRSLMKPHNEKSKGVKSGDLCGHRIGPFARVMFVKNFDY